MFSHLNYVYIALFEIELFLTLKLYLRLTELLKIKLFWHLTVRKQKLYLY